MRYKFVNDLNKKEFNTFVKNHEFCNLLQSYEWANIKSNWEHLYTGVYDEKNEVIATGLVLIKKLPMNFTMFYLPRGPVMDHKNMELLEFYFNELKKIAKRRKCLFIKCDPAIHVNDYKIKDHNNNYYEDTQLYLENYKKIGAVHKGFTMDFASTVQPRFHMVEYKDTFGMEFMTKKGKKNLKTANKQNLDIQIGSYELLDDFCNVMKCTEERKGIQLRNKEYYKLLLDTYKEKAFIVLGYINIKNDLDNYCALLEQCEENIKNCSPTQKKKLFTLNEQKDSYENKIKVLKESYEKYGEKTCISGTLSVCCGKTSEILYAGMNEEFKRYMAPYLVWYKTMEECLDKGCETSNMGGIEGSLEGGLVNFKEVFYPTITEFIGEFDIPVNKLLFKPSLKAYDQMKKRHLSE